MDKQSVYCTKCKTRLEPIYHCDSCNTKTLKDMEREMKADDEDYLNEIRNKTLDEVIEKIRPTIEKYRSKAGVCTKLPNIDGAIFQELLKIEKEIKSMKGE